MDQPNPKRPKKLLLNSLVIFLTILLIVAIATLAFYILQSNKALVKNSALKSANLYSQAIKETHDLYSSEVSERVRAHGIEVTHLYKTKEKAIPLPGTLIKLLDEQLQLLPTNAKLKIYSPFPFPWRQKTGGLRDDFAKKAWAFFKKHPNKPYYQFETKNGKYILRYATASIMQESCIDCHNTHIATPKSDWKIGGTRGILEIAYPVQQASVQSQKQAEIVLIVLSCVILLTIVIVVLLIFKR